MFDSFKQQVRQPLLPDSRNILAICFLVLTGLTSIATLVDIYAAVRVNAIARRKTTFVQLVGGKAVYVSQQEQNYRTPQVLTEFVTQWTQLALNWDAKIPGTSETDPGFRVEGGKVPLSAYFASLMMEPDFGKAMLPKLAQLVPNGIFQGSTRQTVIVSYLSPPRQIAPDTWEIDMVATRVLVDLRSGTDERIPFNRTFRLQAVEIQQPTFGENSNPFERKVYELRAAGLQIHRISEYIPQ